MIYFEIRNKNKEIITSNIKECPFYELFLENKNKTIRDKNLKSVYKDHNEVSVWLIVHEEKNLLKSNKIFNKTIEIYGGLSKNFLDYFLNKIKIHSHTLIAIQGKMRQKMDSIAELEDFIGKNYYESKKNIEEKIKNKIEETSDLICFLNKRIIEIDIHMSGFDILYLGDQKNIEKKPKNIKKVLLDIYTPHSVDFENKNVSVLFEIDDEFADKNKISLDYKLFNLAMWNFFDNAVKYSKESSKIYVEFKKENDNFEITFTMKSIRIEREELKKIFNEGYFGKNANFGTGNGLGMAIIKKALALNDMEIDIRPNYGNSESVMGKKYAENIFTIKNLS